MLESRTISISIARNWRQAYEAAWRPQDFCRWASGLSQAPLIQENSPNRQEQQDQHEQQDRTWWTTEGPEGPIRIRFTAHNPFGVMDHSVDLGNGRVIHVPMRMVANGDGAEVLFTLFRQPWMSDEQFAADAAWVERDLLALQALLTSA